MKTSEYVRPLLFTSEVTKLSGYSNQHLRRLGAKGAFPRRVRLGVNRIGWDRGEVQSWITERMEGRNNG